MVLIIVVFSRHHNQLSLVSLLKLKHAVERKRGADVAIHNQEEGWGVLI